MSPSDADPEFVLQPQDLRIPRADNTLFARPDLASAAATVEANHALLENAEVTLCGKTLAELRAWTRHEAVAAAVDYTQRLTGTTDAPSDVGRVVVAGHQPALFHSGVWAKNLALAQVSRAAQGVAINLVVDNDTFSRTSIRVPVGTREHPRVEWLAFDKPRPAQPWEDAEVLDGDLFDQFGGRVSDLMGAWGIEPIIASDWPIAVEARRRGAGLADALTAARLHAERQFGVENFELPIRMLCELGSFRWFVACLLGRMPEFHHIYNKSIAEYRRVNQIRGVGHPIPDLKQDGEWLEAPFWVWKAGTKSRGRLMVRSTGSTVELSDGIDVVARFSNENMEGAVAALESLSHSGYRLRTRALTTTLFARLCLGDLFIHGIGGAKYDEMTDQIIFRMFGIQPPKFQTLSATLYLGMEKPFDVEEDDVRRLQGLLRDLRYNSDRHLPDGTASDLVDAKRALVQVQQSARTTGLSRRERRVRSRENFERFRSLQNLNAQLAERTVAQQEQVLAEIMHLKGQLDANRVLKDREFAYCLYGRERIEDLQRQITASAVASE